MILRCYNMCYVVLYFFIFLCSNVNCFNIDVQNYVKHRGNPNSMFGFSVALHREKQNSWLIVGAPTAQTTQPGVERGGAVYRCDINNDNNCSLIDFDSKGNINDSDGKQVDMKSNQWFGATVASSGEDGIVLACAPRYMWFTTVQNRRDPVGTCYIAKNEFQSFSEYSPCRTRNWGYHRQGSCQAGLGASVSRDGRRLYIGAPGSWYWQGQLHSVDAFAKLPYVPPRFTLIEEGQVTSQNAHARPDVISTREGPSTDDDSYLGYSVAVGEFGGGSGGFNDVAVGMPRGGGLVGKVVLYNWNMTNLKNFTGNQLGAYFGYSLAVCDVDGDSRDDILVGAPLYTDLNDKKGYYETGRVYILYQRVGGYEWTVHFRDGTNSRSRFGTALTSLGDLNLDGYGDFAVGAPYDGPKQRGAVYIYLGSNLGAREKPSQIIFAEQVDGLPSTFGFSLAGGLDLDENLYPDLLIGAYDSSTTVFLRTRPVVNVDAKLDFLLPSKQISLEEKNCSLRDRTKVPCVELNTCLNFTGINVDRRLEFEIQFILDSKKPHSPRMFFVSEENRNTMNQTIRLDKNKQFCKKTTVYIKPNVRDKLTSLEAEMRYGLKLSESSRSGASGKIIYPVLDKSKHEEHSKRDIILIQKDCGRDNVCIPDLRLIATPSVKKYLLGSGERLEIDVVVQNEGEDAFEAIYELQVPSGLNYVKIEKGDRDGKDLMPVLCSPPSYLNNNTLHCDIGNPLPKEKIVHFKVILQPYRLEGLKPRYEFFMYVNSTNPEVSSSTSDNQMHFKIPIWVDSDLILQGSSQPIDVHYNVSLYQSVDNILQESDIGPQVTHIYTIRNKGPSDILEAEAFILWPSYTLAGEHLFYLLDQPEVSGQVRCEVVQDVNSEKINMEKRRQNQFENDLSSAVHSSLTGSDHVSGSTVSGSSSSSVSGSSSSSWSSSSSSSSGGYRGQSISAEERRRMEEARIRQEEAAKERWRQSQSGGSLESGSYTGSRTEGEKHSSWSSGGSSSSGYRGSSSSGSSSRGSSSSGTSFGGSSSGISTSGGGRVEASRTEQSSSWSSNPGSAYGFDIDRDTSGSIGIDREIIVDARGSNLGSGSWSSNSGSRYPESSNQGSSYDSTRTEHRTSGNTHFGSGRGTSREESFRVRQPGSDSHFEERHYERNSTWNSNDKKPQVSTSWSVNKDGKIDRGSYRGEADASGTIISNKDESYFGHKDKAFNDTWMISEGNRGVSGSYDIRHEGSRWNERPSGSRNYSEERSSTRNTSWTSQGGPAVTSEHSSWSVNRDGHVKNGSNSRVYHEKDDYGKDKFGYDSSREKIDRNSLRGGSRTMSEERETVRNTTWIGSGRPKTEETNRWKVEKDGVVSTGGSSRTYEGSSEHREGYGGSVSSIEGYGSTREGYSSSRDGYESTREGYGTTREGYGTTREGYGSTRTSGGRISSTVYDERSSQSGRGSSHDEFSNRGSGRSSLGASGSSRGASQYETSKEERREESHGRVATNTNIGDLLNSQNNNFGGLGDIAVGPKDGVARTYTFDLGVLEGKNSESHREESRGSTSGERTSGSGSRLYTADSGSGERHSGSRVYTSEGGERHSSGGGYTSSGSRHYEFGSSGGSSGSRSESHYSSRGGGFSASRNEDNGGYSGASRSGGYSSASEVSRSGGNLGASEGSRSGGGSWRYSSTSGTADGDSVMNGGMYSRRQEHSSSSSSSSHYSSRSRRQVDEVEDYESSLKCENTKCITIKCTAGPLKKDDEVVIKVRARVWVHTLKQLGSWKQVNVSSLLRARVSRLPHIGRPDDSRPQSYEVVTPLVPRLPPPPPEVVPLWIIVLSACAGAILLMLLVFILYKLGFFKRNRPSNSPEKQPLNRNGHYPGDEQL